LIALERINNSHERSSQNDELKIHVPKSLRAKLVALNVTTETKVNVEAKIKEKKNTGIIPFAELKCSNLQEVYRISKSFVKDLEAEGIKSFAFSTIGEMETDVYLVTLASCISYLRNNAAVCIVLNNMNSLDLLSLNGNFTKGTFGYSDTFEWGNLTILDYRQISKSSKKMKFEVSEFMSDFECVFWQAPEETIKKELNETYVDIISKTHSVSFLLNPNGLKLNSIINEQKKFEKLGMKLKGILYTRGNA
jgi:hypothetical protein